jgi:hypothetical protein
MKSYQLNWVAEFIDLGFFGNDNEEVCNILLFLQRKMKGIRS